MGDTKIGLNINIDVNRFFNYLWSWARNKEKGMTLYQFYRKIKEKFPQMTQDIFDQYIRDLENAGKIRVYSGERADYVIVNPDFRKRREQI